MSLNAARLVAQGSGTVVELGGPWPGIGPFIFGVYHVDAYPVGNEAMAPAAGVGGRELGSDFGHPSGWSMYHGQTVPGFPAHPHRGFETISIVGSGHVDHADSTGASARYGPGDVQWVTAGRGVSHAEMFPLLNTDSENPFVLYQVWINLPAKSKTADPEFTMQWAEKIPVISTPGASIKVIAGRFDNAVALAPPKHSWASNPDADVALWLIELEPGATVTLPDVNTDGTQRMLYVHGHGAAVGVGATQVAEGQGFKQTDRGELEVTAGSRGAKILVLQGVPIDEPIVQYGPFVMNTEAEIRQAFEDYRRTQFGGWQWESTALVHPRETPRFADYGDGRVEYPDS